ncbi:AMP-binding protein [Leisingera sp. HS039]|uniref:class I adenylate-forming enzyme family protein n=1 Tax=unclassified Leisingera TaxID=2614906 RepID=UPI00107089B9|nr:MULTISPECIES: AMP-binding protein [unclassified Leisingera]MBQ4824973.1 AMP-binding protein [Leisingera sp. HS039]QBR36159.1 long-chain fatty acid--CoA ligase [Leisingera sp. NJS201]
MNIAVWLQRMAAAEAARPALFLGQEQIADYSGFHTRAASVAGWLQMQGVRPGDRVGIFMKNCPDYLITLYGIWYAGAAAVPVNAKLHGKEAEYILQNSGAGLVFTSPGLTEAVAATEAVVRCVDITGPDYAAALEAQPVAEPVFRAPEDLAWLFYTSGTTGRPKGVMITHRMLMTMAIAYFADVDQVSAEDQALYAAPMSHGAGIYAIQHVLAGAAHVCPVSGGFDEAEIFDLAAHFGRVHMFAAPTMVTRMTSEAKRLGRKGEGLRTVIYAGGPMYTADIVEAVEHFGPVFVQVYGQGECPMAITALPRHAVQDRAHSRWRKRLASVGRAQSVVEVRIGTPEGDFLPAGSHGEIMVRGDAVMPGYWNNPEATAKTLVNGWLMTGDMGVLDTDGYLTLQDRSKDMIITGGSNVYPREVEEVLLLHPDVREVSVVGRPHADWGEEVVAFVVGEAAEAALDDLCSSRIARFKRPKAYLRIEALPKNNYGKVLKTELRKLL